MILNFTKKNKYSFYGSRISVLLHTTKVKHMEYLLSQVLHIFYFCSLLLIRLFLTQQAGGRPNRWSLYSRTSGRQKYAIKQNMQHGAWWVTLKSLDLFQSFCSPFLTMGLVIEFLFSDALQLSQKISVSPITCTILRLELRNLTNIRSILWVSVVVEIPFIPEQSDH